MRLLAHLKLTHKAFSLSLSHHLRRWACPVVNFVSKIAAIKNKLSGTHPSLTRLDSVRSEERGHSFTPPPSIISVNCYSYVQ